MNQYTVGKVQGGYIDAYDYKDNNQIMEDYSNMYDYSDNMLDNNDFNQVANYYGDIYNRDFYDDLDSLLYDDGDMEITTIITINIKIYRISCIIIYYLMR